MQWFLHVSSYLFEEAYDLQVQICELIISISSFIEQWLYMMCLSVS